MIRIAWILLAGSCAAQQASIDVYSEFRRVDPYNRVVGADRGGKVRELISPAVVRNAWASFRIAVTVPRDKPSWLYIQQNPERFRVRLYRELYTKVGSEWIPDGLQAVQAPCMLLLPEASSGIPDQRTQSYWLDLWIPGGAPVERVRLQAVLKAGENWIQYPMEIRVVEAQLRNTVGAAGVVPSVARPIREAWKAGWSAKAGGSRTPELTVRHLIARNGRQDHSLSGLEAPPEPPSSADPEWPLDWRRRMLQRRSPGFGRQQ